MPLLGPGFRAMLLLDWRLAIMAFALAAIIFVIVMVFMKPMGRLHRQVIVAEQAKGSHLVETIYGIRTVKSLALEGRRRRKEWDRHVAAATAARHAFGLMSNYPQTLSLPFERLIYSGCLAVGAYMVFFHRARRKPSPDAIAGEPASRRVKWLLRCCPCEPAAAAGEGPRSCSRTWRRCAAPLVKWRR